ncbi:hypothetical protein Btru_053590 [Bulinus truncatus]|nr:hypothetical protein Btru_053590 [Bulinus truncatus]
MTNIESIKLPVMTTFFLTQFLCKSTEGLQCTEKQFSCSTHQCVSLSRVCDGHPDCDNGHDEYCRNPDLLLDNYTEPCFKCADGTCISPHPPVDSIGSPDWFLCDGISHCKDSWDEHEDACWRHVNILDSSTLLTCVPSNLQFGKNNDVMMWGYKYCNGVEDCSNGLDEKKCPDSKAPDLLYAQMKVTTLTVGLIISVIILMVPVGFIIYKIKTTKRQHRSSTSTAATVLTQTSGYEKDAINVESNYDDGDDKSAQVAGTCHVAVTSEVDKRQEMVTSGGTKNHFYKSRPKLAL